MQKKIGLTPINFLQSSGLINFFFWTGWLMIVLLTNEDIEANPRTQESLKYLC